MITSLPSVERLNHIQTEWMKLDPGAPKPECDRVFKLMNEYPKRYVSGHDGKGVVMIDGGPMNQPMDFGLCLQLCKQHGGRVDVAWNGKLGQWYAL